MVCFRIIKKHHFAIPLKKGPFHPQIRTHSENYFL